MPSTDFPNVQLEVSITTKPANFRSTLEDYFDRAYNGERGTDEDKAHFLNRKVEEHIQAVIKNMFVRDHMAGVESSLINSVKNNLAIKQRKDKPGPGDETPTVATAKSKK